MIDWGKLIKGTTVSRTIYGGLSLFGMLVGNVRIKLDLWVMDQNYVFSDGTLIAATIAFALIAIGRIQAPGPLLVNKSAESSGTVADEIRGFPRA